LSFNDQTIPAADTGDWQPVLMNGVDVLATHTFQWRIYDWNVAFGDADYNRDGNADLLNNVTHQWQAVLMFA
jgi:hypothetical protein